MASSDSDDSALSPMLPTGFEKPDYDVSAWKTIKVPADWQAEGYDQPRYNSITYPFPANRPLIPHAINPVGSYRRDLELPAGWAGHDVILHIGAAGSAYRVWANGQEVGYSEKTSSLYTLLVELADARGRVVQATASRIGFRTVAVKDGLVTVNGLPITIRGVNRHEHDPEPSTSFRRSRWSVISA